MRRLEPFEDYLIHEFVNDYLEGHMSRRDMIRRVLYITGGVAATATVLTSLGITPMTRAAYAQETTPVSSGSQSPLSVAEDDPRVLTVDISFEGNDTTILGYAAKPSGNNIGTAEAVVMASPSAGGALPVVMICHENRGLTDHIKDIARRYAVAGYMGVAIDLLSRSGGTAAIADPAEIPSLLTKDVDPARHAQDFVATVEFLRSDSTADVNRLAMTGFCFGGGVVWRAATVIPDLKAAAPYYGPPPPLDQVPNIKAAMLGIYSSDPGDFANEGRDDLVAALEAANVVHEIVVYPNTKHAFNNDTGQNYNEEAALAAWKDTLEWFDKYI
jgi:carboxymethylenebutenolidase